MIGITEIASYLPKGKKSNFDLKNKFDVDEVFITEKLGVETVTVKSDEEETSDLCVNAFNNLKSKIEFNIEDIDCAIVITQNPDYNLPHTAAIVHGKLGLKEECAAFDVSLGCSGYVYGLSIIESFMEKNGLKNGLLFTADPYSKIINSEDKNTVMLFGDGASVTLVTCNPKLETGKFTFGTIGKDYANLICRNNTLEMNGRAIFNFASRYVPKDIEKVLQRNGIQKEDIDIFILHQGSKFIVDTIKRRSSIDDPKVIFDATKYGNTISSSIPIILEKKLLDKSYNNFLISGFGVGLSWSSCILKRVK